MKKKILAMFFAVMFFSASFLVYLNAIGSGNLHISSSQKDIFSDEITRQNEAVTFTNISLDAGFGGKGGSFFAWGDYNNDDCPDLLVNGRDLYRNGGPPDYNFTLVSNDANLTGGVSNGVWGDYDSDGYLDIFCGGGADKLYRNRGDGTFEDMTVHAGLNIDDYPTTSGAWGDYDRDGDLDLYITNGENWNDGNYIHYADRFYSNDGDGTFTDATVASGMDTSNSPCYGRGVIWGDYDNDGWQDIYVSNYRLKPNYIWINNRDGTFTNKAAELGVRGVGRDSSGNLGGNYYGHTIGSSFADLNNNGRLDIFVSNLVHKDPNRGRFCDDSKLYVNNGPPHWNFTDARATCGIPIKPVGGVEGGYYDDENFANAVFADYDNDGDMDLWITQVYNHYWMYAYLYRNNGDLTFTNMAPQLGLDIVDTYAGAWADYDNDGDQDLVTAGRTTEEHPVRIRLFRNEGNSNHWLKIKVMDGTSFAIGAQVRVHTNSGMCLKQVETGVGSHSSQNDMVLHFGLGQDTIANRIEIEYPDGTVKVVENINADQVLVIEKPSSPPSIESLTASTYDAHENEMITFSISTDVQCQVAWDFGNDGSDDTVKSSSETIDHSYYFPGSNIIRATAWNYDGSEGTMRTLKVTSENMEPSAILTGDAAGFENQMLYFYSNDTFDSLNDLKNMSYELDFGDGNSTGWSNSSHYSHSYENKGSYTLTLRARDDDNVVSETSREIEILNVLPEIEVIGPTSSLEDQEINFRCRVKDSLLDMGEMTHKWDFGDGYKTDYNVMNSSAHTYKKSGNYSIILYARDRHGDMNSSIHHIAVKNVAPICDSAASMTIEEDQATLFTGTAEDTLSDLDGLIYQWDFYDGTISPWSVTPDSVHTYTQAGEYRAILTVKDDDEDTDESIVNITVENQSPEIELSVDYSEVFEDQEIEVAIEATDTPSDLDDLQYRLNFGDGNATDWNNTMNFRHSYEYEGSYLLTASVRDNSNLSVEDTMLVAVLNEAPSARFTYSPSSNIEEGMSVTFDAALSMDTLSDIPHLNFTWTIDNSVKLYGMITDYIFGVSGKHKVILTVTDDDGESMQAEKTVTVKNLPPEAVMSISPSRITTGAVITFNGTGSIDTLGDIDGLTYEWKIGNLKKTGIAVEHVFTKSGSYEIVLSVTDSDGDSSEISRRITVTGEEIGGQEKSESTGGFPLWLIILIVFIVVLAILFLILILARKGKGVDLDIEEERVGGSDSLSETNTHSLETEEELSDEGGDQVPRYQGGDKIYDGNSQDEVGSDGNGEKSQDEITESKPAEAEDQVPADELSEISAETATDPPSKNPPKKPLPPPPK